METGLGFQNEGCRSKDPAVEKASLEHKGKATAEKAGEGALTQGAGCASTGHSSRKDTDTGDRDRPRGRPQRRERPLGEEKGLAEAAGGWACTPRSLVPFSSFLHQPGPCSPLVCFYSCPRASAFFPGLAKPSPQAP